MTVEITGNGQPFVVDQKRLRLGETSIKFECPECGTCHEKLVQLSFPKANETFDQWLYCDECCHEWSVKARLEISFTIIGDANAEEPR